MPSRPVERYTGLFVVSLILGAGIPLRRETQRRITGLAPASAARAEALPFSLVEASRAAGLLNVHEKLSVHASLANVAPYLAGLAGASVAVADFDGDGYQDIYVTNAAVGSKNRLYRNNHDGTFTDVAQRAGVADVNQRDGSLRALFFDYDNDGRPDLLITTTWCPRLFHNNGDGTFTEAAGKAGLDHCGYAHAANVLDYDGDGWLDVLIGGFYPEADLNRPSTTRFMPTRMTYAARGGPAVLYRNNRDGTFSRAPGNGGISSIGWTHAVGVYDLRGTGRPDLYLATDFNSDQLYYNEGGRFRDASVELGRKYSHFAMSAEIADLRGGGRPALYVTDIYEPGHCEGFNALWEKDEVGRWREIGRSAGVSRCGWSWGIKFVDLANEGRLDIVVSNGMISGDPRKNFWYNRELIDASMWRLQGDAALWPEFGDASFAGYQHKCVFRQAEDGRFEDISALTAIGRDVSDGRGLAVIDYLNEGSPSLVMAAVGQPLRFYRNEQRNRNDWIGFSLVGTRSARDAFGALVTVELRGGHKLSRELEPGNGFESESDKRLLFGLGERAALKSVSIRWPSGTKQVLASLALRRYHTVTEPR